MSAASALALLLTVPLATMGVGGTTADPAQNSERVLVTVELDPGTDVADTTDEIELMGISARNREKFERIRIERLAMEAWIRENRDSWTADNRPLSEDAETAGNSKRSMKAQAIVYRPDILILWADAEDIDDIASLNGVRELTIVDRAQD